MEYYERGDLNEYCRVANITNEQLAEDYILVIMASILEALAFFIHRTLHLISLLLFIKTLSQVTSS